MCGRRFRALSYKLTFPIGEVGMTVSTWRVFARIGLIGVLASCVADAGGTLQAQRRSPDGYISGTVRSTAGPEAGVWGIAETKDLPTNFIKIVVTDDAGKVMGPELPGPPYP